LGPEPQGSDADEQGKRADQRHREHQQDRGYREPDTGTVVTTQYVDAQDERRRPQGTRDQQQGPPQVEQVGDGHPHAVAWRPRQEVPHLVARSNRARVGHRVEEPDHDDQAAGQADPARDGHLSWARQTLLCHGPIAPRARAAPRLQAPVRT
jgi:hypothetical protein